MTRSRTGSPPALVVSHDRVLGGRPVFRGTRVEVDVLFDNLADGYSLDEIIREYPTLDKEDLRAVLAQAREAVKRRVPDVTAAESTGGTHARVL